jgi:hypothetical protein
MALFVWEILYKTFNNFFHAAYFKMFSNRFFLQLKMFHCSLKLFLLYNKQ